MYLDKSWLICIWGRFFKKLSCDIAKTGLKLGYMQGEYKYKV